MDIDWDEVVRSEQQYDDYFSDDLEDDEEGYERDDALGFELNRMWNE